MDLAKWTRIEAGIPETRQSPFVSRGSVFASEYVANVRTYEGRSHCRVRLLADRISKKKKKKKTYRDGLSSKETNSATLFGSTRLEPPVTSGVSIAK